MNERCQGRSFAQKLVPGISGGVFDLLDPVLERHSLDNFGKLVCPVQLPPFPPGAQDQFEEKQAMEMKYANEKGIALPIPGSVEFETFLWNLQKLHVLS